MAGLDLFGGRIFGVVSSGSMLLIFPAIFKDFLSSRSAEASPSVSSRPTDMMWPVSTGLSIL